jgi:RHS repeat-associated protein
VPGTGTVTFKYDPFGRRLQKGSPLGTTNYLYDGVNLLEEVDQVGNVQARHTQSANIDEPLSELRSGTTSYYEQDGSASVSSLSNPAAILVSTYTYDSFGKLSASSGALTNPFQYAAREFDSETGIYEYRARYYNPTFGRFISEDPIGFFGGDANVYRHVWNSPTNFTDPIGEAGVGVSLSGSVEGGLVGVGAGATGSIGGGAFYGHNCNCSGNASNASAGGFASGGAFAGGPGWGRSAPSLPNNSNWVLGAYAGGGVNVWASNANNVCDLSGPFKTYSFNLAWGWRALTIQYAVGKNSAGQTIRVVSYGGPLPWAPVTGGGFGGSVSAYNTNTVTTGRGCGCP